MQYTLKRRLWILKTQNNFIASGIGTCAIDDTCFPAKHSWNRVELDLLVGICSKPIGSPAVAIDDGWAGTKAKVSAAAAAADGPFSAKNSS